MNAVTFGRYVPNKTVTNKLDPRTKIFCALLIVIAIFFQFKLWSTSLFFSGVYLILVILLMIVSKVSFLELLRSLKGMWFLILFLFAVYIFIPNSSYTGPIAFYIGSMAVHWDAFYQAGYIITRLLIMMGIMMVLTTTTKPLDLTNGMEWFFLPLKVIHFPAHEIAMTLSIALRFIPTLLEETNRIMKAQSSRGVDFTRISLVKKFRAIISLIVPLFVSAIQRSEELANAMEIRGYDPKQPRTKYRGLKFHWSDLIGLLITLCFFGGVITIFVIDANFMKIDIFKMFFGIELGL